MSDHTLNNIMCLALTDGKFRDTLLTDAANVVGQFDLDADEQHILGAIQADSVTEFAAKLHNWMVERGGHNGHRRASKSRHLVNRLFLAPTD